MPIRSVCSPFVFSTTRCSCTPTDLCPSSVDEIAHLERVIELHKTKYSLAVPFVPPPKPTPRTPLDTSTDPDASVFNTSLPSRPGPSTASYVLPPPPPMQMPLRNRNRPPSVPTHLESAYQDHTHVPSSPIASSIASSTPSSPCKPSSPVKAHEVSAHTDPMQFVDMCTFVPPVATQTQTAASLAFTHARSDWEHISNIRQTLHGQCAAAFSYFLAFSFAWRGHDTDETRARRGWGRR